jgi:signal transduction histidine kinase
MLGAVASARDKVRPTLKSQSRDGELAAARDQLRATREILRVISASPTDLQPVLDTVARNAARLCGAQDTTIRLVDGDFLRAVAHEGPIPVSEKLIRISRDLMAGRVVLERRTLHIGDLASKAASVFPESVVRAKRHGVNAMVVTPLLREGVPLGTITVRRAEARPFSDSEIKLLETFAAQAVIAIENARLFREQQASNRDLAESLEQQTATSEILRVISSSPADATPVFETIVTHAARLCEANFAVALLYDGARLRSAASTTVTPAFAEYFRRGYPVNRETATGRAALERATVQIPDILTDPEFLLTDAHRDEGVRTVLAVPMLHRGALLGVISTWRLEVRPFTREQIRLLESFADQAVIAIENARLFNETKEAFDHQRASAEVLEVISSSVEDTTPVFEKIVESCQRLFKGRNVGINLVGEDGAVHLAAYRGAEPREVLQRHFPVPLSEESGSGAAILQRRVIHYPDTQAPHVPEYARRGSKLGGNLSVLFAPMLRESGGVGAIFVGRPTVGEFSEKEIALLKTFADQAVIAIENVRLFKETKQALEKQTAISEILRVISASPTDVQPVFEAIVRSAVTLCGSTNGAVFRYDGELLHYAAGHQFTPEWLTEVQTKYPMRPDVSTITGRAILSLSLVHIDDVLADPQYDHAHGLRGGWRNLTAVPMVRDGVPLGVIVLAWAQPGAKREGQEDLLKTFADQAVIAIENVRLFNETNEALDHQRASAEVLQVISGSVADTHPVFEKILESCERLFGGHSVGITLVGDDGAVHLGAYHGRNRERFERNFPVPLDSTGTGVAIAECRVVRYPDVEAEDVPAFARVGARAIGFRSVIFAPMVWEGRGIGAIFVGRDAVGEFSEKEVALLKTFADQAVIAIQNAKLFHEIEEKSRQLEVASRHKSEFLANMSHELRTPLNAVLGYTELVLDGIYGEVPDKVRDVMARIDRSGRHLLGLINDVLDLSKIEAGQLELSVADYSLQELVQTVAVAVEALAAEKKLALGVDVAADLPRGHGDERRLSQVLLNLVGNALKFTEHGEVRVAASVRDGEFVVAVADTGPGIAAADQRRIFDAFQQADGSATRKKGGTGLGLSIARRIVELHGGRIWVESAPGKGSTFTFAVPVRAAERAGG